MNVDPVDLTSRNVHRLTRAIEAPRTANRFNVDWYLLVIAIDLPREVFETS